MISLPPPQGPRPAEIGNLSTVVPDADKDWAGVRFSNFQAAVRYYPGDLSTNQTFNGDYTLGTAGVELAFGNVAILSPTDGKWYKADATALATLEGLAAVVVDATIAADAAGRFMLRGIVRDDTAYAFTAGLKIFADVAGALTQEISLTGTQIIREMGACLEAGILKFDPAGTIYAEHLVSILPMNTATVTKDDAREAWYDHATVDLTAAYVETGAVAYSAGAYVLETTEQLIRALLATSTAGKWEAVAQFNTAYSAGTQKVTLYLGATSYLEVQRVDASNSISLRLVVNGAQLIAVTATGATLADDTYGRAAVTFDGTNYAMFWDGVLVGDDTAGSAPATPSIGVLATDTTATVCYIGFSPSDSYADAFLTDTVTGANGRYAQVAGTLGYDSVNKRMSLTAAAGASVKGRLKSYQHTEGSYSVQMTLPASATDGDAMIHYLGTQGSLATGYGVGVVRVAGAWNVATASGTTVTDTTIAVTGLADGDSFTALIERDPKRGVTYAYIYETTQPTAPQVKIYNVHQEAYQATWYKNAGAGEVTAYVDDIRIRAESVAGRTNVVQEVAGVHSRYEFGEDVTGALTLTGTWAVAGGELVCSADGTAKHISTFGNATHSFKIKISDTKTDYYYFGAHRLKMVQAAAECAITLETAAGVQVGSTTWTKTVNAGDQFVVEIVQATGSIIVKDGIGGSAAITETPTVGSARPYFDADATTSIDDWDISGTLIEYKPIRRGALLETFWDGSQEVIGTTLIRDFNWDCIAEMTKVKGTSWVVDTVNACIAGPGSTNSAYCYPDCIFTDGYFKFDYMPYETSNSRVPFVFRWGNPSFDAIYPVDGYYLAVTQSTGAMRLATSSDGTTQTTIATYPTTFTPGAWYKIEVLAVGSSIKVYVNGVLGIDVTDTTFTSGFMGHTLLSTSMKVANPVFIGLETNSTNGIAATIPPVGGGARFGVEEQAYLPLVAGTDVMVGRMKFAPYLKATNAAATGIAETFALTSTGAVASLERAAGDLACEIGATTYTLKGGHNAKFDLGSTVHFGVKRADPTVNNHATVYVDSLHLRRAEVLA